ncbi:MAG: hypothetical protein Q7S74_03115 [Nanoarchaeota archaeon]|nr:hypothetical protein [Nanoarchaeota archaeon]
MEISDKFIDIVEVKEAHCEADANKLLKEGFRLLKAPEKKLISYNDPQAGPIKYQVTSYFLGKPTEEISSIIRLLEY